MPTKLLKIRALSAAQSRALLRRQRFGRIAFTFKDRVDIEPISYVAEGPWLYARTSRGTKLRFLRHNPWVAFEVDDVRGPFEWKSVVARGTVYFLNPGGEEHPAFQRAVKVLRKLDPNILTDTDSAPARTVVFRIHVNSMTGRQATAAGARRSARKSQA
jgi:nitroimidazol reductase NimA-like FMN-containing flavoprotein (pyridoxamine 5'-phosphate oxidase superfamily)